jgi:hypothetical protein
MGLETYMAYDSLGYPFQEILDVVNCPEHAGIGFRPPQTDYENPGELQKFFNTLHKRGLPNIRL